MSVWRIPKVDGQTRTLAEAAAKASGLPLGVWLERAILRRVDSRTVQTPPLPSFPVDATPEIEMTQPDISPEMQAALDAAERRRHRREPDKADTAVSAAPAPAPASSSGLTGEPLPADPFATPEKLPDDAPFEQPVAETDQAATASLTLDEDELPSLAEADPLPDSPEPDILVPLEGEGQTAGLTSEPATLPVRSEDTDEYAGVTTTSREPLVTAQPAAPASRGRALSSLPLLAAGLVAMLLMAGAAYVFLDDGEERNVATAATPAQTPQPAVPAASPAVAAAPAPAVPASPAQEVAPPAISVAPSPNPPAPSPPAQAGEPLKITGPSILNLALENPQPPQASPLAAVPEPIAQAASPSVATPPPASAVESLPALRARAEAGDVDAQFELGRRYILGNGMGKNDVEAGKWLLRAAQQGHAQAQFNVGVMYERGVGLETNLPKAIDFYRKAAAQNTPMAMHNLGLLFVSGNPGVKSDPVQARRLMTQAAEWGQLESQYSLALMHFQGVGGAADKVAAMAWMAIAARPNQPQLIDAAQQLAAQLTPAERVRARDLADSIMPRIKANLQKLQAASASPQTVAATPATTARTTPRVIDRVAIGEIQKLLASLKIYGGSADGAMGPRTTAAIREFQAMSGMPVDGKPSIDLLENLREVAGFTKQ